MRISVPVSQVMPPKTTKGIDPDFGFFSREGRLDWRITVLISFFVWAVFGLRDLLILIEANWPHLYGVIGVPTLRWEEVICYLPFAKTFSFSNLSPIAPAVDKSISGVSFFPPLSMCLFEWLFKTLGWGNMDVFLYFSHSAFSLLNFWLAYLVFRVFIHKSWALLFAFLGIGYFSSFSSLGYIVNLVMGKGSPIDLSSLQPPEISRIPFPGISLPFFSLAFYLTVRNNRLKIKRIIFLSLLWGIQLYVYAFNYIAGVPFFILWLLYARYITDKKWILRDVLQTLAIAFSFIGLTSGPYLIKLFFFQDKIGQQFVSRVEWVVSDSNLYLSRWGAVPAYGIPGASVILAIYLFRDDFYELFYKFSPIFIALSIDLMVGSLHIILGKMLSPELYQHRISGILFRFLYFIPLLYFLQNPLKTSLRQRDKFSHIIQGIHGLLKNVLIKHRTIVCGIGMVLIGTIEVLGAVRYFQNHQKNVAPAMEIVQHEMDIMKNEGITDGPVVYERLETNLAIPVMSGNTTLLVNSYGNYVDEEEILNRIVLYAKIVGWNEQQFMEFMLPSKYYVSFYRDHQFILDRDRLYKGLGFWLLNHHRVMSENQIKEYREKLISLFAHLNLADSLVKYKIRAILSESEVKLSFAGVKVKRVGSYYLTVIPAS